jgi:hypothetical protein
MKNPTILFLMSFLMMQFCANAISITGEPLLQATINVYPGAIQPGNDGYIQIVLKNVGTATAERISLWKINTDAPIKYEWIKELGSLDAGSTNTAIFKFSVLDNASPGLYYITFIIDYCKENTCKTIYPTAIINIASQAILEIKSIKPNTLKLGERVNLSFIISNKGDEIKNIIFNWVSIDGALLPIGSTNRIVIPSIKPNSSYEIFSEIVTNPLASPGVHQINISLWYSDKSGINQSINFVTGIEISGETDFEVSMQEYSENTITLAVVNVGPTTAYSTIIKIPQQKFFRVLGSSSNVIGNLDPGDYTLASFQLVLTNTTDNLIVEISYTDLLGIRRVLEKSVAINIERRFINATSPRQRIPAYPQTNSTTYIIIGIIGIVCIIAIIKLRKVIRKR